MFKFNLGETVKHKVTGFSGIVIARTNWLHAPNCYGVQSTFLDMQKGVPSEPFWINEDGLEFVSTSPFPQD